MEQLGEEAAKKAKDSAKSQNTIRAEFNATCNQLGIKGENIRMELVQKLSDLPKLYNEVANSTPDLLKASNLYAGYSKNEEVLPLLRHVIKSGNTTVYEFLYSEPPLSVEEPGLMLAIETENEVKDNQEIDFGDDDEIDFGEIETVGGEIDWGDIVMDSATSNYEIDLNTSLEESGIVVEGGGISGGVAKNEEALSVLDCIKFRDQFIDELYELESFLKMRLFELTSKTDLISMTLLDEIAGQDLDTIQEMLGNVEICLTKALNPQLQYLYQVKHSASYIDILSAKVRQKMSAIEKLKLNEVDLKEKSKKCQQDANDLRPNMVRTIAQTKSLQDLIEQDISKRYKNRDVNLMGGVNTL